MVQRILVFQQNGSGEKKISGIRKYGGEIFRLDIISYDEPFPPLLEDSAAFLPEAIDADLVLDYLKHPDLSYDLAEKCRELGIPVVASGKKWPKALTPATWCALARHGVLGKYGERFGAPEFSVSLKDGKIFEIRVVRGAPCGATWEAARQMIGEPAAEGPVRIGLISQMHCVADPSGWDPISGKSPVHIAGELHGAALRKALGKL